MKNEDNTVKNELPEASAVAWFEYKRKDGFIVSFTLRGDKASDIYGKLNTLIDFVVKDGGTPHERYSKSGFQKKEKEYTGNLCPKDQGRLYFVDTKKGKAIKCENSKYDFKTGVASGCDFFEFVRNETAT